jgi:hypothetical protein
VNTTTDAITSINAALESSLTSARGKIQGKISEPTFAPAATTAEKLETIKKAIETQTSTITVLTKNATTLLNRIK